MPRILVMDDDELLRAPRREGTACRETTPRCRKNALARPGRTAMLVQLSGRVTPVTTPLRPTDKLFGNDQGVTTDG